MKLHSKLGHTAKRSAYFLLGTVLFYAPFAVMVRAISFVTGSELVADAHRICFRMPVEWLLQPWMYPTLIKTPMFVIGLLGLPLIALFAGPWFCGNLCPAGLFPELLSKLVPRRFQIKLQGKVNPTPIRYGVVAGMMLSPFLGGYVCCTYCNFTMMQNLVSAATGDPTGMTAWASFTIVTFFLWFVVLGLLFHGGRGFCNFLCPAGALQGITYAWAKKRGWAKGVRFRESECRHCGSCTKACPALAVSEDRAVNLYACNGCTVCVYACPYHAIDYARAVTENPGGRKEGLQ